MVESNKLTDQEYMIQQIVEIQKELEAHPDKDPSEVIEKKMEDMTLDPYQKELVKRMAT